MKILGIVWGENSTAALMIDGKIVAAVSEERFSRVKNDERYPKKAIEYVLNGSGLSSKEIDVVAFMGVMWGLTYELTRSYSKFTVEDRIKEQNEYWYPMLYKGERPKYLKVFKDNLDLKQYPGNWDHVINYVNSMKDTGRVANERNAQFFQNFRRSVVSRHLGIDKSKVMFVDHSTGHAMYAYFASPIRTDALVLTADAWGDDVNASVNVVKGGRMKRISSSGDFVVARLYRYMTLFLGMKPDEHEYKVMGLAAYASPNYFSKTLKVFEGIQKVSGLGFKFLNKPRDMYFAFRKLLEGHRFDAIAGALQTYTENMLSTWTTNAIKKTGLRTVCFGDGVAMNVKANMVLNRISREFFVTPTPSDESQAIGACYSVMYDKCVNSGTDPRTVLKPLATAYLGPSVDNDDISDWLKGKYPQSNYKVSNVSARRIASLLSKGKFGARALGNRSILADPRNPDVIKVINKKVKSRDFWMPFAAAVLEKRAKDYLIGYKRCGAPFMTVAFETTKLAQQDLRAGLHPADMTCRPQVLQKGTNPGYEAIIEEFEKITGVGGLLNTSFNLHGEPIVQTVKDALRVFNLSEIDGLILNDTFIEKTG
jgi:carbamoyltransferase